MQPHTSVKPLRGGVEWGQAPFDASSNLTTRTTLAEGQGPPRLKVSTCVLIRRPVEARDGEPGDISVVPS